VDTFYDTHAHLDYPDYAGDFDLVLARARENGITRIISIGTNLESSRRAIALADQHAEVFAVAGWHPSYAEDAPADIREDLRTLARHPKVVALGETGLDYHRLPEKQPGAPAGADAACKAKQAALFEQHLEVAAELSLNCVIHQRDALEDTLRLMEAKAGSVRGVFHCFVDDAAAMQRIVAMGSLVSFTGIVTFKNAEVVRQTVAATPIDRFMIETDCPYLAPVPYRGKRCEPAYVRHIAEKIAGVKGLSLEDLSKATCQTAEAFFKKLPGQ